MKRIKNRQILTIILIILLLLVLYMRYRKSVHYTNASLPPCDSVKWSHVYHQGRLKIVRSCLTATGTVEVIRREKDGDEHILLRLDQGQENLLNDMNMREQRGDLVLEPVCVNKVRQEDAIEPCSGYINDVQIPRIGDEVSVNGTYVLDEEHGWMEIHPVTFITIVKDNSPAE